MYKRTFALVSFLWLVMTASVLALSANAPLATAAPSAQAPSPVKCDEMQVIFVVDQSGSMSQTVNSVAPSDPNGLRFFGPQRAVETLSALRYQAYVTSTIRIALIHFGDKPKLVLPWTSLDVTDEAEHQRTQQALAPSFAKSPSLGNTNPLAAAQMASSLFNQVPAQNGGCPARAVILITDGQPSLPTQGFSWPDHLTELAEYVKQYMSPPDHELYVIGIDQNNTYWTRNLPYWVDIVGAPDHAIQALDQANMGTLIIGIVEKLAREHLIVAGSNPNFECIAGGTIAVPPFVQQAKLTLIKPSLNLHLDVLDETGRPLEPSRTDIQVKLEGFDSPIESLTINKPRPGIWTLRTPLPVDAKDRCQVRWLSFDAVGKLNQPTANSGIVQFKRAPVSLQIVDSSGDLLPDYNDPNYALNMDLRLTGPSQTSQPVSLNAGASYEFTGEILPTEAGLNTLDVKATTHNADGSERVVFNKTIASFPVTPVKFSMTKGPTGIVAQHRPLNLEFALRAGNQPVEIDLTLVVTATLTLDKQTMPLDLQRGPNNIYQTKLTPDKQGEGILRYRATVQTPSGLVSLGEDQMSFNILPTTLVGARFVNPAGDHFIATDWFLRPTGLPLEIQLVDGNGQELSQGQIAANNPQQPFELYVLDAATKKDLTSQVKLVQTGKPGNYRFESNALGIGNYDVSVKPIGDLAQGYLWEADSWSKTFQGDLNPGVFGVAGSTAFLLLLLAIASVREVRARQHPLDGWVQIFKQVHEGESTYPTVIFEQNLPHRNRAVIHVGGSSGFLGRILSFGRGRSDLPVEQIVLHSETEADSKAGRARAEIKLGGGRSTGTSLSPEASAFPVGAGFYLVKGPRKETRIRETATPYLDLDEIEGRS